MSVSQLSLREALREETRPQHESIEGAIRVSERSRTREGYRFLIERFHGYYAPIERRLEELAAQPGNELAEKIPAFARRRKLPWLTRDLHALGLDDARIAALPECPYTPKLESYADVAGCLYVLEGSTLGGQMISKQLAEKHQLTPESGAAFYSSYGEEIMPMWRAFAGIFEDPALEESRDSVLQTARETFDSLDRWFREGDEAQKG